MSVLAFWAVQYRPYTTWLAAIKARARAPTVAEKPPEVWRGSPRRPGHRSTCVKHFGPERHYAMNAVLPPGKILNATESSFKSRSGKCFQVSMYECTVILFSLFFLRRPLCEEDNTNKVTNSVLDTCVVFGLFGTKVRR